MCETIYEEFTEQCKNEVRPRFCEYCAGTSGLTPEQEKLTLRNSNKFKLNLLDKIVSFGKALSEHATNGFECVAEAEKEKRLAICQSCEKYQPDNQTCAACGCYLQLKAAWKTSSCPLHKWPDEQSSE